MATKGEARRDAMKRLKDEASEFQRRAIDLHMRTLELGDALADRDAEVLRLQNENQLLRRSVQLDASPGSYGPYLTVLERDDTGGWRIRCGEFGNPYVFAQMGPHDNHTPQRRRVVSVYLTETTAPGARVPESAIRAALAELVRLHLLKNRRHVLAGEPSKAQRSKVMVGLREHELKIDDAWRAAEMVLGLPADSDTGTIVAELVGALASLVVAVERDDNPSDLGLSSTDPAVMNAKQLLHGQRTAQTPVANPCICRSTLTLVARPDCPIHGMRQEPSLNR